jgi:hypothetical protein
MPELIREFRWVLHSVLVLGPTRAGLKKFFEDLAFELTTHIAGKQDLGMRTFAVPEPGPLCFWLSSSLGKRGKSLSRLSLIGVHLEDDFKEVERLLPLVDGGILLAQEDHPAFENFFKKRSVGRQWAQKPWVFIEGDPKNSSLRLKALKTWIGSHADKVLWTPREGQVLEDSLTWILEESL